ncbi:succinate dehydrogenase assembly factor 1, mitochondrial isoform X2 [Dendrobium catenatum]|uniref:succinate dehydrogenase assembly factor 1, mitochondrial isoform X2 n=1 Tax=Dendrobium catenatum TaxID=906689 RepID=UPI0010A0167A|nr:succinate dehydrogenase assembly factor 1, mitochondrial isoform X2 [Dendrobium catenatum]XP_028554780.1 succinate dehydrogenase assembly factor 1, mitochondrial isoform X2 [Dendrobium catenatum]XP_028554781.1 succinate dehydrogenase assembly factor 1, mitochondrial isoform X2 [Dendrobium catenatum]XP_028554782.1 succinate dehydrogenase assembly factor 1, mitochondrial isoform X2 [Dendrobium catenatum]XP_028554783.1 succinate dehydrogenase assembly factor 1, mitochondrial isoform X2 [Dendrob
MASPWKLSGMQRQVLALYRCFLRAARVKNLEDHQRIVSVVSAEFHHNANNVDRKNFQYIEYLLRRGKRQLEQLKNSTTLSLSTINLNSSASKTITEDKKLASTYH